jgi:hypothetical protein
MTQHVSSRVPTWTTRQWLLLVTVLVAIIVLLLLAWPRPAAGPDQITVRVVDGATPISTVVVPLRQ